MSAASPCPSEDALDAFVEHRAADPALVEAHLDSCAPCRMLVAHLVGARAAERATASLDAGPVTVTEDSAPTREGGRAIAARRPGRADEPRAAARPRPEATGAPIAPIAPGDRVARYVVERELGRGGMGVVFAAYDPALQRKVALKVVRADDDDQSAQARMMREARAMASLAHPNVVTIHDVGELPDGQIFLAMELVDGQTLRALMRGPQPIVHALDLFAQAGRGLAAAHAAGLVHRDFKPDNVLVGRDGRVRVTDFGLVRPSPDQALSLASGGALTAAGSVLGTPAYMAPEQHVGIPASAQADQFAFAVALYEALTGKRPFTGASYDEIRTAKLHRARAPWPAELAIPEPVRAGTDRALARAPEERHATMQDLLTILDDARARLSRAPNVAAPPTMAAPTAVPPTFIAPTQAPGARPAGAPQPPPTSTVTSRPAGSPTVTSPPAGSPTVTSRPAGAPTVTSRPADAAPRELTVPNVYDVAAPHAGAVPGAYGPAVTPPLASMTAHAHVPRGADRPARPATSDAPIYIGVGGAVVLVLALATVAIVGITVAAYNAKPSKSDPGINATAWRDDPPAPVPVFVPFVHDATPSSTLPCPEGTSMRRPDARWIYCGNTRWTFEGPSLRFHASGKLARQETYVRGRRDGRSWSFTEDGVLESIDSYSGGELDGLRVELHPSGRTRTEYLYRQGSRHGVGREWGKDGKLTRWVRYESGKVVETRKL
ncbi:MAG: protein kinase [Labilithrix sp.]|nr:protein kinase [Labilithrix sp.]